MTQAARTERLAVFSIPVVLCVLLLILVPAYLTNPLVMGGLILIEIVFASLWHFESVYLPLLMAIFIWGGSLLPFSTVGLSARWLVLGVGAVAGSVLWMRGNKQSFTILHLAALFCVSSAFVTALVSNDPWISLLKVGSLGLLFLYGSTGARLALPGRETMFIRGLVSACEGIVYGTALCYAAGFPLWGNPNSLGAVMGVVMLPMMV